MARRWWGCCRTTSSGAQATDHSKKSGPRPRMTRTVLGGEEVCRLVSAFSSCLFCGYQPVCSVLNCLTRTRGSRAKQNPSQSLRLVEDEAVAVTSLGNYSISHTAADPIYIHGAFKFNSRRALFLEHSLQNGFDFLTPQNCC
ncbi:hypothetical protein SCHPADRAFT_11 [Schizopora paradoxa]|uniref:Uncharacterized protein n=1 Tax=Schizopora paradoxa TaxID=27342 RepID=A0A0H2ST35_9AGAM|nr:hypothetical protein SCHPADRAFT_11 [Schizopora paradoxa]